MKFINLEYHPNDSRIKITDDEICQTLSQRMGTGGNNVPLILALIQGGSEDCLDEYSDGACDTE